MLLNEGAPVAERAVAVPLPVCAALNGFDYNWPGTVLGLGNVPRVTLPAVTLAEAERQAAALRSGGNGVLTVRSGSVSEGRTVACHVAEALGRGALFIEDVAHLQGLAPWLILRRLLPVFCFELGPGERKTLPALLFYQGPIIALGGPDGSIEARGETVFNWSI